MTLCRATLAALTLPALAAAQSTSDTRLLSEPAVSATHVAFAYAGDLWSTRLDGSNVVRLTTADGDESSPVFSPDGALVAFTGNYDGNNDVYVVPVGGGIPKRLTWHPGGDQVQAFSPDGRQLLFVSTRLRATTRIAQLFTVAVTGGPEVPLPIPSALQAAWSPDGRRIAYNPLPRAFEQWKRYRGGRNSTLHLYTSATHATEMIPQPASRANDVDPMWMGNTVYFRSDRNGEFNLFSYDLGTKQVKQLTTFSDFPILAASMGGGKIVYERQGYLYLFDPATAQSRKLTIGVAADLREVRPRWVSGNQYIRGASISPSGARVAFALRGEIVTVPAEKGDPRNLTNSPGVHEQAPAWSPDGQSVAYFSDEGGEYQLHVAPQSGNGPHKVFKPGGAGFYESPRWSPDGKRIAFFDNSQSVFVLDLDRGTAKRVGGNAIYAPIPLLFAGWSPDSKWLAWSSSVQMLETAIFVYNVDADKTTRLTDGLSAVSEPVFDKSGKYLYLLASTDAGPALDWFAQSTNRLPTTTSLYAMVLRNDLPTPLAPESDEEKGSAKAPPAKPDTGATATRIDIEGLSQRIIALPIPAAQIGNIEAGDAGSVYYARTADGKTALRKYDLTKRKDDLVLPEVQGYSLSADGKKLLYSTGGSFFVTSAAAVKPGEGRLATSTIQVRIDPRAEWSQIFDEAWRVNRDFFYATNMHGVDWPAAKRKYAPFLADATTKADVNRVMQWMMSELSVGHHRGGGGDRLSTPTNVPGGLLGADYTIANGRYRFAKIYGGLNWTPGLGAPLTEPGINVSAGDYLLAVRGVDLRGTDNIYALFENTAGKAIEITVGPNPDGTASRTITVVPIGNESALRTRAWVERNVALVDSLSGGRLAYVYVPNTGQGGYDYFRRYFYPQAHKEGIVVDERDNGGGQISDYYIDILNRPVSAWWTMRYGAEYRTPAAAIMGPKTLIVNEMAGSGGDMFPYMWRKFGIGPIVGKRTWGGLVGVLGFPIHMDGGNMTAPNLAFWTPEDGYGIENIGVPPDIEVEQTVADVIAGHDPQLERAVAITMAALLAKPVVTPKRPPFPDRTKP